MNGPRLVIVAAFLLVAASCAKDSGTTPPPTQESAGSVAVAPAAKTAAPPVQDASLEAPEAHILALERVDDTPLPTRFKQVIAEGAATGRQTLVMFTADWCSPCRTIKELMHDSPTIRKAMAKAQLVTIDVDEWRGPAHRLIPGAVPDKLPLLVVVDAEGKAIQQSFGTALGLLSETATAENLTRMLGGEAPVSPAYMDDKERRLALAVEDMQRQKARVDGIPAFESAVIDHAPAGEGTTRWRLKLTLRNHEASRRWYVLTPSGDPPKAPVAVTAWARKRFAEHVRANYTHFEGEQPYDVVPVAGWGSAVLDGWTVEVPNDTTTLSVWKLSSAEQDGTRLQFDKKVPHDLVIEDASALAPGGRGHAETLEFKVMERYEVPLTWKDASRPSGER